jgi:LDH2 family malate/lactate/ureidoglycolate dehydrogenase
VPPRDLGAARAAGSDRSAGAVVAADDLRDFVRRAAGHAGLEASTVDLFTAALVEADLRGVDTHGVVRVPAYVRGYLAGELNPGHRLRLEHGRGAVRIVDADNGLGCVVGQEVMDLAVTLAQDHGVGVVAVRNSNHAGMLAQHVLRAVDRRMVGYFVSNGPPVMAGWGGREPLISNNPMAYAFPAGRYPPIVLDMACSAIARGKLRQAAQNDVAIPLGWAIDDLGRPTTDPHAGMRGLVMPMAGHKGYGLAVANEVLSGVLPGAKLSFEVSDAFLREGATTLDSWGVGHLAVAMDVTAFGDYDEYLRRVDELISRCKRSAAAPGHDEVLIPGEPEWRVRAERLAHGVPVSASTLELLDEAARDWGITGLRRSP